MNGLPARGLWHVIPRVLGHWGGMITELIIHLALKHCSFRDTYPVSSLVRNQDVSSMLVPLYFQRLAMLYIYTLYIYIYIYIHTVNIHI